MPAELQRLQDEGWLAAFRAGDCHPIYSGEQVEAEPALSASEVAPNQRTAECMMAAERLRSLQREYQAAADDDLAQANRAIVNLAPGAEDAGELCPNTDETLFGAELAVARYLNATQTNHGAPFGFAMRDCSLPTLGGPVPVRIEASEEETGPGGYDYFALDGVIQRCTYGVEGYADGCKREAYSLNCDASCQPGQDRCCSRPYGEYISRDEGTVTIVIGLSRAAMGCGSTGLRAYYVRRDGSGWHVVRELVIGVGNHGV